jgi:hypothetical protein
VGINNKSVTATGVTVNDGNSGGNYNVSYANNANSTITKATLYYTAAPASFVVGQTPTGLTGTLAGYAPGDNVADSTTGSLYYTTSATASSPAGRYAIDGFGLNSTNYAFRQASSNATALTLNPVTVTQPGMPPVIANTVALLECRLTTSNGKCSAPVSNTNTRRAVVDTTQTADGIVMRVQIVNDGVKH